jgi:hypothetical protein
MKYVLPMRLLQVTQLPTDIADKTVALVSQVIRFQLEDTCPRRCDLRFVSFSLVEVVLDHDHLLVLDCSDQNSCHLYVLLVIIVGSI